MAPAAPVMTTAMRDLFTLAQLPDFDRVQEQIGRLGGCTHPVQLVGYSATLNAATGEALHVFNTDDHPTGRLLLPCGNRRASRCPACSRIYAADTYQLIKAGLSGGKGIPETVSGHPRVFATFTAPSFGAVHNRAKNATGTRLTCKCGHRHTPDDPSLGTPINPTRYDYSGAVLWNAHAPALWQRFTVYLRRAVAAALEMTVRALNKVLRISFAKVAEYQKRGLVHYHAIIRFDGPEGSDQEPPEEATTLVLIKAIRAAAKAVFVRLDDNDAIGSRVFRWGRQIDARSLSRSPTKLSDHKVAAYVAKYATKGAETAGTLDRSVTCPTCKGRGFRLTDGRRTECQPCDGTGQGQPLVHLVVQRHVRQMIRTAWDLGGIPDLAHLKLRHWAHMLGFRGHFSSKSRRYSTTLGELRGARRTWRTERAHERIRAGLPEHEQENTTLITESSWAYLGNGYSPGEELLAATVRQQHGLAAQLKYEGKS
ncbi:MULTISPECIES: replication initiator [unclassified Streptomyces]|uniref:replication initiator n=1 Tax=unclassified Streptomyces TaxID=2593676 RepID=UPI0013CDC5F5|nr:MULTISPECIES: replication initiator [unclassified Streptomyces]MCZ4095689.1 zinc finger-like domain-containing protein [Streptomyces sp. H39-C1]NEA72182.1 replication initiation protein [Streptomyces sp. SID13588]